MPKQQCHKQHVFWYNWTTKGKTGLFLFSVLTSSGKLMTAEASPRLENRALK